MEFMLWPALLTGFSGNSQTHQASLGIGLHLWDCMHDWMFQGSRFALWENFLTELCIIVWNFPSLLGLFIEGFWCGCEVGLDDFRCSFQSNFKCLKLLESKFGIFVEFSAFRGDAQETLRLRKQHNSRSKIYLGQVWTPLSDGWGAVASLYILWASVFSLVRMQSSLLRPSPTDLLGQ